MESPGEHESGRYKMDCYKAVNPPWNMIQQHQIKEQSTANALVMNKKILSIFAERDAAIRERNIAVAETNEALAARDEALQQLDKAIAERDTAIMERDNVLAMLQCRENLMNSSMATGTQRVGKRLHHPTYHPHDMAETLNMGEIHATDALPLSTITSEELKSLQAKKTKENKNVSPMVSKAPRSVKKMGEDLNKQVFADVKKSRSEWDSLDMGLNLINFDETIMPPPVCTCTGLPRQCYKWGNGGWQSSCCTTTLSCHPLPQMPNKRHARVGGRKMSGSVFLKLLSRFAAEGHDLSMPLDLKNYWARHGTNRYITIK